MLGKEDLPSYLHLVSAGEAGFVVCLITNPIWVVKTRLQLQQKGAAAAAAVNAANAANAANATAAVAATGGARLAGMAGVATGAATHTAGVHGGVHAPHVTYGQTPRPYRGFVDALVQIARTEGVGGLYKGLSPSLFLVSHGGGLYKLNAVDP